MLIFSYCDGTGKGKFSSIHILKRAEIQIHSFLTSVLMEVRVHHHTPAALPSEINPVLIGFNMGLGVLQSLSGIFRDQTVPCFCRG
jgi:hypothetical protein